MLVAGFTNGTQITYVNIVLGWYFINLKYVYMYYRSSVIFKSGQFHFVHAVVNISCFSSFQAHQLPSDQLSKREVTFIDIANDPVSRAVSKSFSV